MKKSFSIFSILSLVISVTAILSFWLLLDQKGGYFYIPWLITGTISIFFPIMAKYFRKRKDARGAGFEIAAIVIGFFNFYWVLAYAVKLNEPVISLLCILACVIYGVSFKKTVPVQKEEDTPKETSSSTPIVEILAKKEVVIAKTILLVFLICCLAYALFWGGSLIVKFFDHPHFYLYEYRYIHYLLPGAAALIVSAVVLVCLIKPMRKLCAQIVRLYRASMAYKEKCCKKVARMKRYLDNGIITEEEFEKNKADILKNIET